jgi:hypothetical protein
MKNIYEKCIALTARDFGITEEECDKIIRQYKMSLKLISQKREVINKLPKSIFEVFDDEEILSRDNEYYHDTIIINELGENVTYHIYWCWQRFREGYVWKNIDENYVYKFGDDEILTLDDETTELTKLLTEGFHKLK